MSVLLAQPCILPLVRKILAVSGSQQAQLAEVTKCWPGFEIPTPWPLSNCCKIWTAVLATALVLSSCERYEIE